MKLKKTTVSLLAFILCPMLVIPAALAASPESATNNDFQQALKSQGWDVQQEADGTLSLRPPPQISDSNEKAGTERENDVAGVSSSAMESLQQRLQASGWIVSRDADGALVFQRPKAALPTATVPALPVDPSGLSGLSDSPYWRVERADDGSLLLYPEKPEENKSSVSAQVATGVSIAADFKLPVDEWAEAKSIAAAWVASTGATGLAIGKIRKIFRVYLISIVDDTPPFSLEHQIAVRQSDGHVIVLN